MVDLLYDHYLATSWERYSKVPQSSFLLSFYTGAAQVVSSYPNEAKIIVTKLIESDNLSKYQEFEGFVEALHRIDGRLSPRVKAKDSALNYIGIVEQQYTALKSDFEVFFPDLVEFFKDHELGSEKIWAHIMTKIKYKIYKINIDSTKLIKIKEKSLEKTKGNKVMNIKRVK